MKRPSAKRARISRLFWYRQTGSLFVAGGAMGTAGATTLFDALQFMPDPLNQRADTQDVITVMHQRLDVALEFFVTLGGGTAVNFVAYLGVYVGDRNNLAKSAAYSTPDAARTDWLDAWVDPMQLPGAIPGLVLSQNTGQGSVRCSRIIRTKRKVQADELVWLSAVVFPHSGTAPTTWSLNIQWQHSILLRKGS